MYEEAKEALVSCTKESVEAMQSKARTISSIRDTLSRPSMAESQAAYRTPKTQGE